MNPFLNRRNVSVIFAVSQSVKDGNVTEFVTIHGRNSSLTERNNSNTLPVRKPVVLFVDTDKTLAEQYGEHLTAKGYKFYMLRDPRAIPQNIKIHKPDILVMELVFDQIHGEDVIRGLRKKGLKLPIVVITRQASKSILLEMKQWNVNGFYIKPISPDVLEARIQPLIAERSNQQQRRGGMPSALIITGNKELNMNSCDVLPLSVVKEYGYGTVFVYTTKDAVETLKARAGGIKPVIVDGNNVDFLSSVMPLLDVVQNRLKLPLYIITEKGGDEFSNVLSGIPNVAIINKSDPSGRDAMAQFENQLLLTYEKVYDRTSRKRDKIITDLKSVTSLPPLPDIFLKIEALASNPNATVSDYGEILELDPGITARILRMSNSTLYAFKRKINSVKDAVALMGTQEILSLVRLACITGNIRMSPEVESHIRDIWTHSSLCAISARHLYQHLSIFREKGLDEELFIAGIIHDIGKIVIAKVFPDTFLEYVREKDASALWNLSDEKTVMGINHCEAGMRLAEHWKLPKQFAEVIAYHHDPAWNVQSDLLKAIHLGNYLSHLVSDDFSEDTESDIDTEYLELIGVSKEQIYQYGEVHGEDIRQKADILIRMIMG
jgi:putative nucleotidyltransferase with HDIG domain